MKKSTITLNIIVLLLNLNGLFGFDMRATEYVMEGDRLSNADAEKIENDIKNDLSNERSVGNLIGYWNLKRYDSPEIMKKFTNLAIRIYKEIPLSSLAGLNEIVIHREQDSKNYKIADKIWKNHISKNPKNIKCLENASVFYNYNDIDYCIELQQKCLDLDSNKGKWHKELGFSYKNKSIENDIVIDEESAKKSYQHYSESIKYKEGIYRWYELIDLAYSAFHVGNDSDAEKFALESLKSATKYKNDWNYGNAIFDANTVLGLLKLKKGKTEEAIKYLLESGKSPGSPQLNSFGPDFILANRLLEKGESVRVIEFLQSIKKFWKMYQGAIVLWIDEIKKGRLKKMDKSKIKWDEGYD